MRDGFSCLPLTVGGPVPAVDPSLLAPPGDSVTPTGVSQPDTGIHPQVSTAPAPPNPQERVRVRHRQSHTHMPGQGPLCPYVSLPTHAPRVLINPAPIAAKRRQQRCPLVSRETSSLSADVSKPHRQRMRCCRLRAHSMSPAHQLLRSRHTRPIRVSYSATRLSASRRRLASGHRGHASDPTAG